MRSSNRGVSDVVGFVLVFSLVILLVGTVYVTGLGGLQGARDHEQVNNAERAFGVLDDNVNDLVDTGVESRTTSLKLANARLTYGEPVMVEIAFNETANISRQTYPIVYAADSGQTIRYTNGAVVRTGGGSAVLANPPAMILRGNTSLIPLVVVRPSGPETIGGSAQVLVHATRATRSVHRFTPTDGTIEVNITTPNPRPWHASLSANPSTSCQPITYHGGAYGSVECTLTTNRVVVQLVVIDVAFS